MAVRYVIRAQVVDIRRDRPRPTDALLVDTQVWLWEFYPRAAQGRSPPLRHQATYYPGYLRRAHAAGARLYRCGLSLAELAHLIEKNEREMFEDATGTTIPPKEYRHNYPAERARVVAAVQQVWNDVKRMSLPLDVTVDDPTTDATLTRFGTQPLDGYDLFLLEALTRAGLSQVLTDDGDFGTVPGVQVFTANGNTLTSAATQNRLMTR